MQIGDILHLSGGIIAAAYFIALLVSSVKNIKVVAGAGVIAVACFVTALLAVALVGNVIYINPPKNEPLPVYREYYLSAVVFMAGYALLARAFGIYGQTSGAAAEGLIIFSFVARIACCINDCCGSKDFGGVTLPLPQLELAFAAAVFVCMRAFKIKDKMTLYAFIYSVYRFGAEFLRANGGIRTYGGLNIRQLTALVIIAAVAVYYVAGLAARGARRIRNAQN